MHEMPMGSFSYDIGASLDPLMRMGIIFYFETTFIHTKSERTKSFATFGDRTGSHDMDFDWADELLHTAYGKKWLEFFISDKKLQLSPAEVTKQADDSLAQGQARATVDEHRRAEELRRKTLLRARELAMA